ncbi:hypothetical protein [Dyella humicola]|uniref:hypothetical protein n=1 Tax=Dyella humicola TaxID=2992126 RepID=UPI002257ADFB|nr:hypothetical protein [Dyella humicola]
MAGSPWHQEETFKSLTTLSIEALRFISIANGGAAIAVVAYGLGKLPNASLMRPMTCFLAGVTLTAIAYVLAYVTQLALYNETAELKNGLPPHGAWLWATGIVGVLAVAAFITGCVVVVSMLGG